MSHIVKLHFIIFWCQIAPVGVVCFEFYSCAYAIYLKKKKRRMISELLHKLWCNSSYFFVTYVT
ncbi:unnamed protein product [Musa acuminata subsp. malaccensis]|uniref:(wild Malaysian banana) hypothetical protein n=1 Tax=Musa acuminata subsp. malaccensis TaxID=214687 RepID=A0A804KNY0_MUSAM|nr:unnamed protein product [Musa acuminata subsp. malaccensis]